MQTIARVRRLARRSSTGYWSLGQHRKQHGDRDVLVVIAMNAGEISVILVGRRSDDMTAMDPTARVGHVVLDPYVPTVDLRRSGAGDLRCAELLNQRLGASSTSYPMTELDTGVAPRVSLAAVEPRRMEVQEIESVAGRCDVSAPPPNRESSGPAGTQLGQRTGTRTTRSALRQARATRRGSSPVRRALVTAYGGPAALRASRSASPSKAPRSAATATPTTTERQIAPTSARTRLEALTSCDFTRRSSNQPRGPP